ncbi:MAG: beta-galactosidase trimerization domain-containing protein, partial [Candidatus Latescibacteria bacterium]|nr:beta-galactosidase trimerization domain-containing protein [Candidatus Latescibacterota bacterium]
IIHSKDCNNLMRCATPDSEPLFSSVMGIHRILSQANIPFRFVHLDEDGLDEMLKMKVLFFPLPLCLGREQAERLKEYVQRGGTLICEAQVGHYDLYGFSSERVPGMGLDELFGCRRQEELTSRIESEQIKTQMGEMEAKWLKEVYEPTSGTAMGYYSDGMVAAVRNSYGKGEAILFGSIVFDPAANTSSLKALVPQECLGPVRTEPEVFARMLSTDSEAAVVVVNSQDRPLESEITPSDVIHPQRVLDLWNQTEWPVRGKTITLSLKAWGVAVLLFRRK